ncbi:hypothetical protein EZI54_23290 [Marinobacter halodurans]|uniref:Tetratricopeptide repeat protein n=1 Tax=Marinobacter halodurans TaxID=2528979 RepID=A0ABY1ZDC0_9GAMM|nr:tetratricopeptide repeat protein [Marinobacter halodurans]TBW46393.1 hypothetical protein EZI54_23290 [Marinobacter halodurans]
MSREDWYRNKEWNSEVEAQFFAKLKRARRKEQYLRIQASIISRIRPDVALMLLDQYFSLEEDFDHAQAYCDMASAFLAQGEVDKAIQSYGKALEREAEFPNLKTDAYILYPLTIVENRLRNLYRSANEILDAHQDRLMFPVDHFRWHAAKAIINADTGEKEIASSHAARAFEAAQIKKSGFRFHQKLGLVGKEYKGVVNELRAIHA